MSEPEFKGMLFLNGQNTMKYFLYNTLAKPEQQNDVLAEGLWIYL